MFANKNINKSNILYIDVKDWVLNISDVCGSSPYVRALWKAKVTVRQDEINVAHEAALHLAAKVIKFTWVIVWNMAPSGHQLL